ncbi:preprotein translocase subunit YajC [Chloroflexota bacterium]
MKNSRISNPVLIAGLLLTLATMSGCAPTGGGASSLLPLLILVALVFGTMYFFTVRPMRQRERRHDTMVEELEKGDIVITAGGMYGQIERIDEDTVILKVESGALVKVTKGGVLSVQPK